MWACEDQGQAGDADLTRHPNWFFMYIDLGGGEHPLDPPDAHAAGCRRPRRGTAQRVGWAWWSRTSGMFTSLITLTHAVRAGAMDAELPGPGRS